MNKAFAAMLPILFGVGLLYGLASETMLSLSAYGDPQELSDREVAETPKKFSEPTSHHHEELPLEESVFIKEPEDGGIHGEEEQDKFQYISSAIGREELIIALDESLRRSGITPPHRPYWARLKKIHEMVEARGYNREELHAYSESKFMETISALYGEGEETARNNFRLDRFAPGAKAASQAEQQRWENTKTQRLAQLFKNQDREAIEKWIKDRLSKNEHDIPALYAKLSLYHTAFTIDELLDTIGEIIIALDYIEVQGVPKEAILYDILNAGMGFASDTDHGIEVRKERHKGRVYSLAGKSLLLEMELAGDW